MNNLKIEMFEESLSINKFLCHESSGGDHSKTSVLEFLCLHEREFFGIIGLESERIKADISWKVSLTEKTGLIDGDVLGFDPSNGGTVLFGGTNGNGQDQPESNRDLGQVGDGRSGDLGIEKEGASFDLFSDKETDGGEHCN